MRRVVFSTFVVVLVAATASASTAPTIKPTSIAGAKLGLRAKAYKKLFGKPVRRDVLRFPTNWTRLVFTKRKIGVYLNLRGRAVVVTTWSKTDKTAEGIGPCSSIEEAKSTYGSRFQPTDSGTIGDNDSDPLNDRVYTYTVAKLMFAAAGRDPKPGPSDHVTAVGMYTGPQNMANFLVQQPATSALHCS
jgi:hypothetical protein